MAFARCHVTGSGGLARRRRPALSSPWNKVLRPVGSCAAYGLASAASAHLGAWREWLSCRNSSLHSRDLVSWPVSPSVRYPRQPNHGARFLAPCTAPRPSECGFPSGSSPALVIRSILSLPHQCSSVLRCLVCDTSITLSRSYLTLVRAPSPHPRPVGLRWDHLRITGRLPRRSLGISSQATHAIDKQPALESRHGIRPCLI